MIVLLMLSAAAHAANITGMWHAGVRNPSGDEVFFQLELQQSRAGWTGTLVNGPDRNASTSGSFDGSRLILKFDYWDLALDARFENGKFNGAFTRTYRKTTLVRAFTAQREPLLQAGGPATPDVSGEWLLDVDEAGRKTVYRALIRQESNRLQATLLHVTGDSGTLTGLIDDGHLVLSRFDGIRATLLRLRVRDGVLSGTMDTSKKVTGWRAHEARVRDADPYTYTRMRNPREPFRFRYPDLNGRIVSEEKYRGKVLIVTILGSWCPNCHDETPFLMELFQRYRPRGLEVVAIAFEYTGDATRDVRQLRIFARKFGVPYPILYAGATEEAETRLAQLDNFGSYPTTILIGRDGLVRKIHTGFDGPATGDRFRKLTSEMTASIRALLSEK